MAQLDSSKILIWRIGRPADIWLSHQGMVADVIKKYKLKALDVAAYPSVPTMDMGVLEETAMMTTKAKSIPSVPAKLPWPRPFPGGLRIPHLHYGADIYLLDTRQWREFSAAVLTEVSKRIANAKEVSFEQALELAEAANTLG